MFRMTHLLRKRILIALLMLGLLGVQLLQNSSIHEHNQHVVDCALCHFDTHHYGLSVIAESFEAEAGLVERVYSPQLTFLSRQYSPFQGRSPPNFQG